MKCLFCEGEMSMTMVQQGGMHLSCFETEIPAWRLSGETIPTHVQRKYWVMVDILEGMRLNEKITIEKIHMTIGKYESLKEAES